MYEILIRHNCVVWFYIHFKYLIGYHVIIVYFSVLLPIVSILIMHCVYEFYRFYQRVSGCLCPLSLMLK